MRPIPILRQKIAVGRTRSFRNRLQIPNQSGNPAQVIWTIDICHICTVMETNLIKDWQNFCKALFERALDRSPFDTLCTLLRPRGMNTAGWDVLDEAEKTFDDFNWMIATAHEAKGKATARRFAVYYYCFLIEMAAVQEMIINVLRCVSGRHYLPYPFLSLFRQRKKGGWWNTVPPSMSMKRREIVKLAREIGESALASSLEYIYDDTLRNAIAHSDYVLTTDEIRMTGPNVVQLAGLDRKVNYTFRFVEEWLRAAGNMKLALSYARRFHKWDNYEVLELLSDESGVYGFHVHFSNGNKSTFMRTKEGVTQINMRLDEGGVGFMVGVLDDLEPIWKVDGIPVTDFDELNRRPNEIGSI